MKVNESSIQQIMDMGFSREDAIHSLDAANGDVNQALNIIFQSQDDPIPPADMKDNNSLKPLNDYSESEFRQNANSDTKTSIKFHETPQLPLRQISSQSKHIQNVDGYERPIKCERDKFENNFHENPHLQDPVFNEYSVYADITKYKRPFGSPAVLMPINNDYFESYLNPILTILHEIPTFRSAVFKHEFPTLGFHQRWFQGSAIPIPSDAVHVKTDDGTYDLSLLLEVQRLFAFLEPKSKRAFTSIKSFISSFPPDAKREFSDIESLRDAYEAFQKYLTLQLKQSGVKNSHRFFQNQIKDDQCEEIRDFGMFSIEADEIKQNLYKTLHTLLWHDDIDSKQTITKLADVAAFTLEPSYDDGYVPYGLELNETLFPQIYTTEFQEIVADNIKQFRNLDKKKRTVSADLMRTRVFRGKQVSSFLGQTLNFLELESSQGANQNLEFQAALKDLQLIEKNVTDKKIHLIEQHNKLAEKKKKISPHNINSLIEKCDTELEPYLLTGVILSPITFIYLKKKELLLDDYDQDEKFDWIYTECNQNNFVIRRIDFEEVKRAVFTMTSSQLDTSIVLIYVKKSSFTADITIELPNSVKEFLKKDETALEQTMELLSSTDEGFEEDKVDPFERQLMDLDNPELLEGSKVNKSIDKKNPSADDQ